MVLQLIQRLEKSVMSTMVPMRVIVTFALVCERRLYPCCFGMSGEVVGVLSVNHGCVLLGEEEGEIDGVGFVV